MMRTGVFRILTGFALTAASFTIFIRNLGTNDGTNVKSLLCKRTSLVKAENIQATTNINFSGEGSGDFALL